MGMKTKHTPGPWSGGDSDLQVSTLSVHGKTDGDHSTVCRLVSPEHGMPIDEIMANARLIAAAPDMLEALQLASTMLATGMPEYDARDAKEVIDAAIAKATGARA